MEFIFYSHVISNINLSWTKSQIGISGSQRLFSLLPIPFSPISSSNRRFPKIQEGHDPSDISPSEHQTTNPHFPFWNSRQGLGKS
jgi:hypothetical protein